jgi:molybdopterin cofactor biosynthesis moaC region
MNQKDLETVMQAWINASLELAEVMEAQGMTRIAPVLQLASGKDSELLLRIVTPEEEDGFWEDDEEGDA